MTSRGFFASRFVIPLLAAGLLVVALLSPLSSDGRYGDPRLSTSIEGPLGASGFFETLSRLGWRPERQIEPGVAAIGSDAIFAVLAPPIRLSERETGVLLGRVRAGASLLLVIENGTPLADSLGLLTAGTMTVAPVTDTSTAPCPPNETPGALKFLRGKLYVTPFSPRNRFPEDTRIFMDADNPVSDRQRIPVAIGFALGQGRIAAVSDANLLRNDVIRVCRWNSGFRIVRMVEYLSDGRAGAKRRVVFDEFHQGFGQQPDVNRAIVTTLTRSSPGRAITQIALAAMLLLLAIGPRPIAPDPRTRVERRSPFEHVDALASAYRQAGATQVATTRLVHGLRRRIAGRGAAQPAFTIDDVTFLDNISRSHPQLSGDIETLHDALGQPVSSEKLEAAGRAIERIERTVTK